MPRQKKLAQAGRAGTKHSLPASPAVVLLCGEGVRAKLHPGLARVCRDSTPRVTPAPFSRTSGQGWPWRWDMAQTALWASLPCDSAAKIYSGQKDKRNTRYGTIAWMFINIQPHRRHLQCLWGWPMSSVCFPILLSALLTGLQSSGPVAQNTRKFLHRCPVLRMDGQEFDEVWDETQANVTVYLCLKYSGHPVSPPRLGQVWFVRQLTERPLICRGFVQDCVLEGLALPEAPSDCSEKLLNN